MLTKLNKKFNIVLIVIIDIINKLTKMFSDILQNHVKKNY